jgi:hypothetical protein
MTKGSNQTQKIKGNGLLGQLALSWINNTPIHTQFGGLKYEA